MNLSKDRLHLLLSGMLRIRLAQEKIERHYLENEMKTPVHLYVGQEAIAVGVCAHLSAHDFINSNHRSHGHYLAKGGNLQALFAELFCRETGCSKGRGGSMHLIDTSIGHMGSSSIVGGGIPIGTGMALAFQMQNLPHVSVVFFGDGAADEGTVYESFNFAMLKKLPVVFVLENNQFSVCSRTSQRQAGRNVFHSADPELLFSAAIDGNDVVRVHETAGTAVERARAGKGPSFIECLTYRIKGHAGAESQDAKGYRPEDEIAAWKARCPIANFERQVLETGRISASELSLMKNSIAGDIDRAFDAARAAPLPKPDSVGKYLFREDADALVEDQA